MSQDEIIDLTKLTSKELMIRLFDRIGNLDKDFAELKDDLKANDAQNIKMLLKINTLESKIKIFSGISGISAALVIEILIQLLT